MWCVTGVKQRDMKGLVGETIQLPCSVNTDTCGDLHSIKWYRGSSRIYVFSEMAGIARAEGDYSDRSVLLLLLSNLLLYHIYYG